MAIIHRIKPRYASKNEEIVARLREGAGAGPPIDPAIRVKRLAAEVAIQMALLHGGDWQIQIDHREGFVLVTPRL